MFERLLSYISRPAKARVRGMRKKRSLLVEQLEVRSLFAGLPFGASPDDTAEFMLGRVAVTPVFLESNGQIDANTENWTTEQKASVLSNIQTGLNWWKQLLTTKSSIHTLDFVIDQTYITNPAATPYEPISRVSNAYADWVSQFLVDVGFAQSTQLDSNIRAFNHSQRVKWDTDWAFTIFVVNSQNDSDGSFAAGGTFDRAFAFAGGLFEVIPSTRPASTFAHETGHMFWARDEYLGGSDYFKKRGYYNAQNTNALDLNPNPSFVQADSIMSSNAALDRAYQNVTSPDSTLAQIGWKDSDGDGIFDVLDVPLRLEGLGQWNSTSNEYVFSGRAMVQTLPNLNSSGLQNSITLNRVGRIEYRLNNGTWQTVSTPNQAQTDLNLRIPLPSGSSGTIEIRAIETSTGIVSNVFQGTLSAVRDTAAVPGVQGFVWSDQNSDGLWQATELPVSGAKVRLVDTNRQPVNLQAKVEPDAFEDGAIESNQNGITIEVIGEDATGVVGAFTDTGASTGTKVFRPYSPSQIGFADSFRGDLQQLRVSMASPTTRVAIDAVAASAGTIVRLEAYDSSNKLIQRVESNSLNLGDRSTLVVQSDSPMISYVVARGIRNTKVQLDNLVVGAVAETLTSANGSYLLPGLPTGSYRVEVILPSSSYALVQPSDGLRETSVVAGTANSHVDFQLRLVASPWQNPTRRHDVNNDNLTTALDVLLIINEINRNGARPLETSLLVAPPFYDVDGNRNIEALDVLIVINYINANPEGGEGESLWSPPEDLLTTESLIKKRKGLS